MSKKNKKCPWIKRNAPATNVASSSVSPAQLAGAGLPGARTPESSDELAGSVGVIGGPISAARMTANAANAQLSTGPVTESGKEIVSQNATKHGLTGAFRVLSGESQTDFNQLLAGFLRSEDPLGDDEIAMVHQMAECVWLSRRSIRMQNDCWATLESGSDEEKRAAHKSLALYLRYQTAHDRTFTRYSTELRKRRNERRRVERGFVSQKYRDAAEARRQDNENRKKELHDLRVQAQMLRQQRIAINNQIAGAKVTRAKTLQAAA